MVTYSVQVVEISDLMVVLLLTSDLRWWLLAWQYQIDLLLDNHRWGSVLLKQ